MNGTHLGLIIIIISYNYTKYYVNTLIVKNVDQLLMPGVVDGVKKKMYTRDP